MYQSDSEVRLVDLIYNICIKYIRGYMKPWKGNLTKEKSRFQEDLRCGEYGASYVLEIKI